jgi:hypothetical protein
MASTYSSLKIELIGTGEQDGTWGNTTNTNLGTTIEQAITGSGDITFTGADVTLTLAASNSAQPARNLRLVLVGTSGGPRQLVLGTGLQIEKQYIIKNELADAVTVKNTAGTGIAVPPGKTMVVFNDATNVVDVTTFVTSLATSGNVTVGGTLSADSPTFTGVPTAPNAANGTNTTQIATTAFVNAAVVTATGTLGTMSSQNANAVAITGGTISGITNLAVADGGTGRSTLAANAVLIGNGTSGLNTVAPGTTGNLLVSNGTAWASTTLAASGAKLGLGITGEVWNNVTSSRAMGSTYTNSRAYPIAFSAYGSGSGSSATIIYINGSIVYRNNAQWNGPGAIPGGWFIVPPGATYRIDLSTGASAWWELY